MGSVQPKTRIDKLVGTHAAALSERLHAHREQLFPPDAKRELRKFTSGEVADLLGVKDAYLRKLDLEGKGPSPETRAGGRRYYTPADIQDLRELLEKGAKSAGTYLPGRRGDDHLQVISRSWRLTAIGSWRSTLTRRRAFRPCTGSSRNWICPTGARSMIRSAMTTRCRCAR
ncbi:hypothetical protein GCM10017322_31710 [Paracoccus aerius]|nr:hypothetical protein GCM10017322_31710 [Paracoccus aerius]